MDCLIFLGNKRNAEPNSLNGPVYDISMWLTWNLLNDI